jgi:hypothetical protein
MFNFTPDRLADLLTHGVETFVEQHLFAEYCQTTTYIIQNVPHAIYELDSPLTGDWYSPADRAAQKRESAALTAYLESDLTKLAGAPSLPLTREACQAMVSDPDPRRQLEGLFATSWRSHDWSRLHPIRDRYYRGAVAHLATPEAIRTCPQLLQQYPPEPLEGLADDDTNWRTPEQITEDRQQEAWVVEMTPRREAGLPLQPFDVWQSEQMPMWCGVFSDSASKAVMTYWRALANDIINRNREYRTAVFQNDRVVAGVCFPLPL